ncbi:MAG TPA: phosphodiester glycosidase family protein [Anaerolineales bacterium]
MKVKINRPRVNLAFRGVLILAAGMLAAGMLAACSSLMSTTGSQPTGQNQALFPGITYSKEVLTSPRRMVVHIVTVDLRQPGLSLLVTPGDARAEQPLKARTTSQFLKEYGVQLAVNGDNFTPWHSTSLMDYYPHAGDPVTPFGLAASQGVIYSQENNQEPVLYVSRTNKASFNSPEGKIYNAISGNLMLVEEGKAAVPSDTSGLAEEQDKPQPRTALALDKRRQRLWIVVVDGRQTGYSEGASLAELAELLVKAGAYAGMNLDGGGSSTLVMADKDGNPMLLNSPIDNQIPGRERPVGNHLGVFAPGAR